MKHSSVDRFVRSAFAVFAVLFIVACSTTPDPIEQEGFLTSRLSQPPDHLNNTVTYQGWTMTASPDWQFYRPPFGGDTSFFLAAASPSGIVVSITEIPLFFALSDRDELHRYATENLTEDHTIVRTGPLNRGILPPSREPAYVWISRDNDETGAVMIEGTGDVLYEWRVHIPDDAPEGEIAQAETLIRTAARSGEKTTLRRRPEGLSFFSQGTTWHWAGDLGDGFLLDRLILPGEPRGLVGIFRPESIPHGDRWLTGVHEDGVILEGTEITVSGYTRTGRAYILEGQRNIRIAIPLGPDGEPRTVYLSIVVDRLNSDPDNTEERVRQVLSNPHLELLLNQLVVFPPEVLE